jgi:hypothetical protein
MNVPEAYLSVNLDHEVLILIVPRLSEILLSMMFPDFYSEFIREDKSLVVQLKKWPYRLVESIELLHSTIPKKLKRTWLHTEHEDICVFNKVANGTHQTIYLYVYLHVNRGTEVVTQ